MILKLQTHITKKKSVLQAINLLLSQAIEKVSIANFFPRTSNIASFHEIKKCKIQYKRKVYKVYFIRYNFKVEGLPDATLSKFSLSNSKRTHIIAFLKYLHEAARTCF